MTSGMIFTSAATILVFISAFGAGFSILRRREKKDNLFLIIPAFVGMLFDCFIRLGQWLGRRKIIQPYEFIYSLIIVIYLSLGIFDEQGVMAGWELVVFRLFYIITFLMAYLTFYFQNLKKEKFLEISHHNEKEEENL